MRSSQEVSATGGKRPRLHRKRLVLGSLDSHTPKVRERQAGNLYRAPPHFALSRNKVPGVWTAKNRARVHAKTSALSCGQCCKRGAAQRRAPRRVRERLLLCTSNSVERRRYSSG